MNVRGERNEKKKRSLSFSLYFSLSLKRESRESMRLPEREREGGEGDYGRWIVTARLWWITSTARKLPFCGSVKNFRAICRRWRLRPRVHACADPSRSFSVATRVPSPLRARSSRFIQHWRRQQQRRRRRQRRRFTRRSARTSKRDARVYRYYATVRPPGPPQRRRGGGSDSGGVWLMTIAISRPTAGDLWSGKLRVGDLRRLASWWPCVTQHVENNNHQQSIMIVQRFLLCFRSLFHLVCLRWFARDINKKRYIYLMQFNILMLIYSCCERML